MWYSSLPGEPAFDVRFCRREFVAVAVGAEAR